MGLISFIKRIFIPVQKRNLLHIYLQDNKCGNKIKLILRKSYDINRVYDENQDADYSLNKVVICDKCFNKINININFNKNYNIISKNIENGTFISEDEFKEKKS